jgi:hypothetical protein
MNFFELKQQTSFKNKMPGVAFKSFEFSKKKKELAQETKQEQLLFFEPCIFFEQQLLKSNKSQDPQDPKSKKIEDKSRINHCFFYKKVLLVKNEITRLQIAKFCFFLEWFRKT